MTTLHQTQVDGVRCFWVETGRPTLSALLVFGSGIAHEPLHRSGFTHLVEHLALHGRGGGALSVNGQVSLLQTRFDAHGPADLVAEHLTEVTSWLAAPRYDELPREREVLLAEQAVRGDQGPAARALSWRYGARGPGVAAYAEAALGRATPELLDARIAQVFGRGNAVLVLDGPPPPGLALHLPDGPAVPPSSVVPLTQHLPAAYVEEAGLVLSGQVARVPSAPLAQALLQETLRERLRDQDGAAYAPWATYEPVDDEHAVLLGGSDVAAAALPTLADTALALVDGLRQPPAADRLERVRVATVQAMRDPYAALGLALSAAGRSLRGLEPQTLDEVVAEVGSVTAEDVAATFDAFAGTLLLGVPGATTWSDQLPMPEPPLTSPPGGGRTYRSVNWPADPVRLAVGERGLALVDGDRARQVRYADVEGVVAHANGVRTLIDADGYVVTVNPYAWRRGSHAVAQLDRAVAPERLLPAPAREGAERDVRLGVWARGRGGVVRVLRSSFADVVVGAVLVTAFVLTVALGSGGALTMVPVLGVLWVLWWYRDRF